MPPCIFRGPLIRTIDDCGCGSTRDVLACSAPENVKFTCVSVPLQQRGIAKYGDIPACYKCEFRQESTEKTTEKPKVKPAESTPQNVPVSRKPYRSKFREKQA